jgi:serine/threonine-protein kinase
MQGEVIAGRYEIRAALGSGAGGAVYEAHDRLIERRVALKLFHLPPPGDTAAAEAHSRFRQGAKAAGRLSHRNIVAVFDYGEDSSRAWMVMEIIEGGSLKTLLDRGERLPIPQIVSLTRDVLSALAYSHERGVVHRDIKPANILLDTDGSAKVTDFGIARLEDASMTHTGALLGTPAYMAPEQLRGEAVGLRADLWATGVVLYQMLTGERPFEGSVTSIMQKALFTEPLPPSLSASVPAAFDQVVARALAKRPEDRYGSATEFLAALRGASAAATAARSPYAQAAANRDAPEEVTVVADRRDALLRPPLPFAASAASPQARRHGPAERAGGGPAAAGAGVGRAPRGDGAAQDDARRRNRMIGLVGGGAALAAAAVVALFMAAGSLSPGGGGWPRSGTVAESGGEVGTAPGPAATTAPPAPTAAAPATTVASAAATPSSAAVPPSTRDSGAQTPPAPPLSSAVPPSSAPVAPPPAAPPTPPRVAQAADPPAPAAPPAASPPPPPVPRLDMRRLANIAASMVNCGIVTAQADEASLTITGLARRDEAEKVRRSLETFRLPPGAARVELTEFDGPFCDLLATVRNDAAAPSPLRAALVSPPPLHGGQPLRFRVETPDWQSRLHVTYLSVTGDAIHLAAAPTLYGARSNVPFGDEGRWIADAPYGTDLLLVVASEAPLFNTRRRPAERVDEFTPGLSTALRAAREAPGNRVAVRVIPVQTAAPQ